MGRRYANPRWPPPNDPEALARRLDRVAWLMDRAFTIPGTKTTFGLDALIGLLPGAGDLLTGTVQAWLVMAALGHYRVPPAVAARMMMNVLVDVAVGCIPILGDLFDVGFKANTRNMMLLEPYRNKPPAVGDFAGTMPHHANDPWRARTLWLFLLPIAIALVGALALVLIGFVTVIRWIVRP